MTEIRISCVYPDAQKVERLIEYLRSCNLKVSLDVAHQDQLLDDLIYEGIEAGIVVWSLESESNARVIRTAIQWLQRGILISAKTDSFVAEQLLPPFDSLPIIPLSNVDLLSEALAELQVNTGGSLSKADVFLSYSSARRSVTEALASDLTARGVSVWWDIRMLPTRRIDAEVNRKIDEAKAVIAIWTPESKDSDWVWSEARRGLKQDKLINTHVNGIDPANDIPSPLDRVHSVEISDRAAIIAALEQCNVRVLREPEEAKRRFKLPDETAKQVAALEQLLSIETSAIPAPLRRFMAGCAQPKLVGRARDRIAALEQTAWAAVKESPTIAHLRSFLMDFPDATYAELAKKLLTNSLAEAEWRSLRDSSDPRTIQDFIAKHKGNKFGNLAQNRLNRLEVEEWAAISNKPTMEGLKSFAARFPTSKQAKVARERYAHALAEQQWQAVQDSSDPAAMRRIILDHGGHPVTQLARARLSFLEEIALAKLPTLVSIGNLPAYLQARHQFVEQFFDGKYAWSVQQDYNRLSADATLLNELSPATSAHDARRILYAVRSSLAISLVRKHLEKVEADHEPRTRTQLASPSASSDLGDDPPLLVPPALGPFADKQVLAWVAATCAFALGGAAALWLALRSLH